MTTATRNWAPANASRSAFTISVHEGGTEIISQAAEEWRQLCTHASDDQPFFRPEWIEAYLRAFAPGAKLVLLTARVAGELCLTLPLIKENAWFYGLPVRKLRSPANSHPGRFDAVCRAGSEGAAAILATWEYLQRLPGWDVMEFRHVPEGGTLSQMVAAARNSGFHTARLPISASPIVRIPVQREDLAKMPPNAKLRSQLRQVRRQLLEKGSLSLRRVDTADSVALRKFYELEASGWKGREGSAITCAPATQQFYDEITAAAAQFHYLSLYLLEWNGRAVAGHLGLCHQDRYYSPKVAYDEQLKRFALGHLIFDEVVKDCALRGIREIDITGSADEWKMKWTSEVRRNLAEFIFHKSMRGRLTYCLAFRMRPALARFLKRKRGAVA